MRFVVLKMFPLLLFLVIVVQQYVHGQDLFQSIMSREERADLRDEARKMFYHGYQAYMENAYPADELMPLSCQGRYRGVTPSRGDMDDALGNFSLTLVDSMDTLAILGDFSEFSNAIKLVINDVSFDQDLVVSVFETNIRMLGGLLSAHVLALSLKPDIPTLSWYNGELLELANDLGQRLLPAFNTTTGVPHGRINLRHGLKHIIDSRETCTACAGTMILEMAALSRLTGDPTYEIKAHRAMDALWNIRHRTSDLMGSVLNIHSGDWVRKDAGIGAGSDSYYEYCLKAYVFLGQEEYLTRFNRHYNAIMKYINRGPLMLDVLMHRPHLQTKNFMDALLAFWPGLQVMLGDVKKAVETHEMLYQVMQKHTLLPEAFTSDFQIHWAQHPLRPEFLESTYFLHRATGDDHYLQVGKAVLKALQTYARVPCGYAAVGDVRTRLHEDRMDSFVLAETFKYLYLLFEDDDALPINLYDYVLTTEAHFLPLALANVHNVTGDSLVAADDDDELAINTCPSTASLKASAVRLPLKEIVSSKHSLAKLFNTADTEHMASLAEMGISMIAMEDGRLKLLYSTATARSNADAIEGLSFMNSVTNMGRENEREIFQPVAVKFNDQVLRAGPSFFGVELNEKVSVTGRLAKAIPWNACTTIQNAEEIRGKIALTLRGDCAFAMKSRILMGAGAKGVIIIDNVPQMHDTVSDIFIMSGDGSNDIDIPAVLLLAVDAAKLELAFSENPDLKVTLGAYNQLNGANTCAADAAKSTGRPSTVDSKKSSSDPSADLPEGS